jgi:hypothetical protein
LGSIVLVLVVVLVLEGRWQRLERFVCKIDLVPAALSGVLYTDTQG